MPSPRTTSKDSSGKRPAGRCRSGAVSSRAAGQVDSARSSLPRPAAAPAPASGAAQAGGLADRRRPSPPPAARPKVMRALPTIGKKPRRRRARSRPGRGQSVPPAPAAPAAEVVDLISGKPHPPPRHSRPPVRTVPPVPPAAPPAHRASRRWRWRARPVVRCRATEDAATGHRREGAAHQAAHHRQGTRRAPGSESLSSSTAT